MERHKLPFRMNCEGYFLNSEGRILAKDSGKGFIVFPGGGVDASENVEHAMIRETKEETGIEPTELKSLGSLKMIWGVNWARTEKQKMRYQQFQGEDMHFFRGIVSEEVKETSEEDAWQGEKFMEIQDVIDAIEKTRPFDETIKEYREMQIKCLKELKKEVSLQHGTKNHSTK